MSLHFASDGRGGAAALKHAPGQRSTSYLRQRLIWSVAVLTLAFGAGAGAQPLPPRQTGQPTPLGTNQRPTISPESPVATGPNGSTQTQVGEVIVTARRREESVQRVPIAISVLGGARLEQTQTFDILQLQTQVPSLQVYSLNPRNTNINIRGLGTNLALANDGLESGVGFYVDNVYYGRPGQAQFDLVDIDQIDVLRGPQGTLFGKNTTAGALNITTRLPSFTPEGVADISGGNYSYFQARASVSGPLVGDVLAGRISFDETTRYGFVKDVDNGKSYNGYNNISVRGQLLYKPDNKLRVRLIADYGRQAERCCVELFDGTVTSYANGAPIPNNFATRSSAFNYTPPSSNPFDRKTDIDSYADVEMKTYGLSAQADYDLKWATLTSITAWRRWIWDPANDADYSALNLINVGQIRDRQQQESEEIRLASNGNRFIDWVVGVYYFYQDIRGIGETQYGTQAGQWLYYSVPVPTAVKAAAASDFTLNYTSDPRTASYAAFGQTTMHFTSKLSLTTGLRYTDEHKTGEFEQTTTGPSLATALTGASAAYIPLASTLRAALGTPTSFFPHLNEGDVSGTIDLAYQVLPDLLSYATYSRGYKSGGLNLAAINLVNASPVVRPEVIDDYEGGLKSRFFDRKVTLNADVFWTVDRDYQTNIIDPSPPYTQYLANIPKVRSRGVEVDAQVAPSRDLNLYTSFTYDEATLVSFPDAPCGIENLNLTSCNLNGKPVPGVSKWAVSAGGEYTRDLHIGPDLRGYVGGDYSYRSRFYSQASDSIYSVVPGYSLVNLRIGLRTPQDRYDLQFWVKNAFNTDYFTVIAPGGVGNTGAIYALIGDPRTYGATLRARF